MGLLVREAKDLALFWSGDRMFDWDVKPSFSLIDLDVWLSLFISVEKGGWKGGNHQDLEPLATVPLRQLCFHHTP